MIDIEKAKEIANAFIDALSIEVFGPDQRLIYMDFPIKAVEEGWIFWHYPEVYMVLDAADGARISAKSPFMVCRQNGQVIVPGDDSELARFLQNECEKEPPKPEPAEKKEFLLYHILNYDVMLARITGEPAPQHLRAKVEKIYLARKGLKYSMLGKEIEFVGAPPSWGFMPLKTGDRGIVFVGKTQGSLYEDFCLGHMWIEEIEGEAYASFRVEKMWERSDLSDEFSRQARPDPKRSYASAVPFKIVENYLIELISKHIQSDAQPEQIRFHRIRAFIRWVVKHF